VILALSQVLFLTCGDGLVSLYLHEGSETGDLALTLHYAKQYLAIMLIVALGVGFFSGLKVTKEEPKRETKEETAVSINWTQDVFDEKVNDFSCMMMGVHGDITLDENYKFKARREYYMPVIYGCFDERVVEQAREEINKIDRFKLASERTTNDTNFKYAQDKEYPIVVWRMIDEQGNVTYNAYTKLKSNHIAALSMSENKLNNIIKTSVNSLFSNKPAWRKLDNEILADKFRAVCSDIWPEDFTNESEDTNEIVVDCTNDATAGCDDLDL
jgi:hypothetical protein